MNEEGITNEEKQGSWLIRESNSPLGFSVLRRAIA
jgi:hypothetical protein